MRRSICTFVLSILVLILHKIVRSDLSLTFEESIFGVQREVNVIRYETCASCFGSGAKDSSHIKICTECGGRGGVVNTRSTPFGAFSQVKLLTSLPYLTI